MRCFVGSDTISGGLGGDILTGGTSGTFTDIFVFGYGQRHDTIEVFEIGDDKIQLYAGSYYLDLTDETLGAWVSLDADTSVLLKGVTSSQLSLSDFEVSGLGSVSFGPSPTLSLTVGSSSVAEDGSATGTVTRTGDTSAALTVNLGSSDTTAATTAAIVTIAAGATSASFAVTPVDDSIVDGTQNTTISVSASGFTGASVALDVTDNDVSASSSVDGTSASDTINASYVDADGDTINDSGQTIYGGAGHDKIYDGAGDDTVYGEGDKDTFYGGLGADYYDGGASTDTVNFYYATAGVVLDVDDMNNSTGAAAGDTYVSIELIGGSQFDDVIRLGAGQSVVSAYNGNDDITDCTGLEYMRGGAGADTFRFIAGDGQRDYLRDYEAGIDIIDLSAWGVTSYSELTVTQNNNSVWIDYNSESLRIDYLTVAELDAVDDSGFIFV